MTDNPLKPILGKMQNQREQADSGSSVQKPESQNSFNIGGMILGFLQNPVILILGVAAIVFGSGKGGDIINFFKNMFGMGDDDKDNKSPSNNNSNNNASPPQQQNTEKPKQEAPAMKPIPPVNNQNITMNKDDSNVQVPAQVPSANVKNRANVR